MRRVLFSLGVGAIMAVAVVGRAQAQMPFNIVAGPTFVNTTDDNTDSRTRFFVAAGTSFSLNETFSVDPYVGYMQKGASYPDLSEDDAYDYIEIPVLLSANIPMGESAVLGISAGPQFSFNINCKEKYTDGTPEYDCSDYTDFNNTEFGFIGGASIGFPLSDSVGLAVGGGADLSVTEVFDGIKNRAYYAFASLGFALGGGM